MSETVKFRDDSRVWSSALVSQCTLKPAEPNDYPQVTFDLSWGKRLKSGEVIDVDYDELLSVEEQMSGSEETLNKLRLHVSPLGPAFLLNLRFGYADPRKDFVVKINSNTPATMGRYFVHENTHRHQHLQGLKPGIKRRAIMGLQSLNLGGYLYGALGAYMMVRRAYSELDYPHAEKIIGLSIGLLALSSLGDYLYRFDSREIEARAAEKQYDGSRIFSITKAVR